MKNHQPPATIKMHPLLTKSKQTVHGRLMDRKEVNSSTSQGFIGTQSVVALPIVERLILVVNETSKAILRSKSMLARF